MKQKELEKLVEEFVEKVKENETIQESDLGEFLVDKEICEMSEIERNYILRSAQAITYKDRYDKSSTSTNKYITQKCIDTVIGEHKLSGRYEKQCQYGLERHIKEETSSLLRYIRDSYARDLKFNRRGIDQMHFNPFCPTMIDDRFMFGNKNLALIPFELRESIPHIITSNLDENNDLKVFDNLSQEEKESVYQTVEKELRKTVYDRLRNFKVEFSNKSNVVTEGIEHVYSTVESEMDKVIKDIFVKYIMDKDIQSIPAESDIKNLEETWLKKALKKIEHKADNFNSVFNLSTNKLEKRKTEKELNEIVEEVFSKYKETFPERFREFLMSTGTTINKVRKEIIQKRGINPQKISPIKCTPEELNTLFKNIVKKYEKSKKHGRTESDIDESEIMNLVGLYTTYFGYKKK